MKILFRSSRLVLIDAVFAVVSIYAALFIRLEGKVASPYFGYINDHFWQLIIAQIFIFWFFGLYHVSWRHASIVDGVRIFAAAIVTCIAYFIIFSAVQRRLPLSTYFLFGCLDLMFVTGARYRSRLMKSLNYRLQRRNYSAPKRVLIVGAGEAGAMLVREIQNQQDSDLYIVGFIDDDDKKEGRLILGNKVIGNREMIKDVVGKFRVTDIYIALPSSSGEITRDIAEICHATGANVKILPSLYDIAGGKVTVNQLRNIEIEDLLQRDQINVADEKLMTFFSGKRILVTGAGGSIGSEICRQLACIGPASLLLVGRGENSIYEIERELRRDFPEIMIFSRIADVRDEQRMEKIFSIMKPQVVFHAAAHKHVPLMEHHPEEAYNNNVFGTFVVGRLALKHGVDRFVQVSTDKAVNPTNIMGASKRLAELVMKTLVAKSTTTRFCAVRFGNVLGSRGSVVPHFRQQIKNGGPITITHPDMKRYFMTIPEACQLVLRAGTLTEGGEIFLLNMGEPIRIVDLALDMISLSGLKPHVDIAIKYTGLRPGEKLFEELWKQSDSNVRIIDDKIYILLEENDLDFKLFEESIKFYYDSEVVMQQIRQWVPEYQKPSIKS
ncbi:MAG: nucleoside-diphosphate sugar epimerase/dehydratase [Negativicutes bacterium]|jgi:FlaA1/EpsC-like NDP-sugar epimerase